MSKRQKKAFSLVEMLAVVAIMMLLIGLLMPAFKHMRDSAKRTASMAQLNVISTAINKYAADFRNRFPGWFSDDQLADPDFSQEFTANENLVVSLIGQVLKDGESQTPSAGPPEVFGAHPPMSSAIWSTFDSSYDLDLDGVIRRDGPVENPLSVNDRRYHESYLAPEQEHLWPVQGTTGTDNQFPELLDISTGMPILYFRKKAGQSIPVGSASPSNSMINRQHNADYLEATGLISPQTGDAMDMANNSILSTTLAGGAAQADTNLAWLLTSEKFGDQDANPNESGQDTVTSEFFLISPGPDAVYFDRGEVSDVLLDSYEASDKFDDLILKGGGG